MNDDKRSCALGEGGEHAESWPHALHRDFAQHSLGERCPCISGFAVGRSFARHSGHYYGELQLFRVPVAAELYAVLESRTMLMVLIPRFLHRAISCLPSTLFAAFCSRYSPSGTFVTCTQQTTVYTLRCIGRSARYRSNRHIACSNLPACGQGTSHARASP